MNGIKDAKRNANFYPHIMHIVEKNWLRTKIFLTLLFVWSNVERAIVVAFREFDNDKISNNCSSDHKQCK